VIAVYAKHVAIQAQVSFRTHPSHA